MTSPVSSNADSRAYQLAWEEGRLYVFFNKSQKKIYDAYYASDPKNVVYVVNCSRKLGKSVLGLFMCAEKAIQTPNAMIAFIAPTVDKVQKYIKQLYDVAFKTCPDNLKPKVKRDGLEFPNGSKILFQGVGSGIGTSFNNLRSFAYDFAVLDEAAFSANLDEIIGGVLIPTLMPRKGRLLMLSTPSVTPEHAFKDYVDQAKLEGAYSEFTLRDSHYSLEEQDKFIQAMGGIDSSKVRREYFCEFKIDETLQLCPEWEAKFEGEVPRDTNFKYWYKYDALDQGWTDNSVCLFADVRRIDGHAILCVEDEVCMKAPEQTTDKLAEAIIAKEKEVFGEAEIKKRIADNNTPSLLQDFTLRHRLYFSPVESKTYLDVMVSDVRELVKAGKVRVSPKCKQLLGCLRGGVWVKTKAGYRGKEFSRSKALGHFDAFAALMYLIRSIDMVSNPTPAVPEDNHENLFVPKKLQNEGKKHYEDIIGAGLDEAMAQEFNYNEADDSYD